MKLFGRYQEMTVNDIQLYSTPKYILKQIIKEHPEVEKIVKEYKPRIFKKVLTNETKIFHPDMQARHRVILIHTMGSIKTSLYSLPLTHNDVKWLGLKPIPSVTKKEKVEASIEKLGGEDVENRRFHVEHIRPKQ
jgi:hypothetical protein